MPIMVPTRNFLFASTRTSSIGRSIFSWRRKNSATTMAPTSVIAASAMLSPFEPMVEKPYRRPPKPMVESATEGLSSGRFLDSFFGVLFSANQAQIMPAAESTTIIQNSTCQL